MRITAIKSDGFLSINGEGFLDIDLSFLADDIHAIQWYGDYGDVEKRISENGKCLNQKITTLDCLNDLVSAFNVKKLQIAEETERVALLKAEEDKKRNESTVIDIVVDEQDQVPTS